MNQKGFTPILIVIILAAVLVGGYLVYQNQPRPTSSPQPFDFIQGKPTTQPSPSPSPTISLSTNKSPTPKPKSSASSPTPSPTPFGANDPITEKAACGEVPPSNSPAFGGTPLRVSFSPSGSVNYTYGTMEGYQWDFDSNGVWDTGVVQSNDSYYIYTKPGTYTATYRVRTSQNTWSKNCIYPYKITISESSSEGISVDKNEFEITVKKSDYPGKSFNTFDAFKVSTQGNTFVSINAVKQYSGGFIYDQAGANLNAGQSFQFHLTVEFNNPPGEYLNEVKIIYTKNGNETVEGPTVKYKIILKE